MTQRRIKWLAIGLIIPIVGILTTVKSTVGIPSINAKGLHWSTVDYAGWRAHDITVSFNKVVKIGWIENIKSLSTESAQAHSVDSHTPNLLASRIKSVEIDNLIIHHDEDSYNTRLARHGLPNHCPHKRLVVCGTNRGHMAGVWNCRFNVR